MQSFKLVDAFTRSMYGEIAENRLNYYIDEKGLTVFGYMPIAIRMSNQIHLLVL